MSNYMNTKQIADLCEKTEQTILNWINKVFPTKIEHGKETQLSLDEVRKLFIKAFGVKIASMLMESATSKEIGGEPNSLGVEPNSLGVLQNTEVVTSDISGDKFNYHMAEAINELKRRQDIMIRVYGNEIKQMKSKQLLLEDNSSKDQQLLDIKRRIQNLSLKTDRDEDELLDEIFGPWSFLQK